MVGTATNGVEAVDACRTLHPDAVVMDLPMPGVNGFEAKSGDARPLVAALFRGGRHDG